MCFKRIILGLIVILGICFPTFAQEEKALIINEIAWMGTVSDSNDEWIELYNPTMEARNISGFILEAEDGSPRIVLSGVIPAQGYFLLERSDDETISDIVANQIYTGSLGNTGEKLKLLSASGDVLDEVSGWEAGDNETKQSMERDSKGEWNTNNGIVINGQDKEGKPILGTPVAKNSVSENIIIPPEEPENSFDLSINEFVFQKENDWVELKCEGCSGSGELIDSYLINSLPLASGSTISDYYTFDIQLPNESGSIIIQDGSGSIIDEVKYGSGTAIDYAPKLEEIETYYVLPEQWSIGKSQGDEENMFILVNEYQIFFSPTRNQENIHENLLKQDYKIVINELDYNKDWIELFCEDCGENGVDFSHLALYKNEKTSPYFVFPEDFVIYTGDYTVVQFRKDEDFAYDWQIKPDGNRYRLIESTISGLGNDGMLRLEWKNIDEREDIVLWSSQSGNDMFQTYIRTENGDFQWTSRSTRGTYNIFEQNRGVQSGGGSTSKNKIKINDKVKIAINEVYPNPDGRDNFEEFIEIYNAGNEEVNMKGWTIDDVIDGGSKPYVVDKKLIIGANEYRVFYRHETGISLNNDTDTVYLISPNDEEIENITYEKAYEKKSYSRNPDGIFEWVSLETPGAENHYRFREEKGYVTRVIDGDTFEVEMNGKKETVRLIGVDAPETIHPDKEVQYFGPEASEYLFSLLYEKDVTLVFDVNYKDSYGRVLAYVYLSDDSFVNELILQNGYGRAYTKYNFFYKDKFIELEVVAKENGLGLWMEQSVLDEVFQKTKEVESLPEEQAEESVHFYDLNTYKDLYISEIYSNPRKGEEEFIEICNVGNKKIDMKDMKLDDIRDGGSREHIIKESITLESNECNVFYKHQTKMNLNNDSDSVFLLDPQGNTVEVVQYENIEKGFSKICAHKKCVLTLKQTPGERNIEFVVHSISAAKKTKKEIKKKSNKAISNTSQKIYYQYKNVFQSKMLNIRGEILHVDNEKRKMMIITDQNVYQEVSMAKVQLSESVSDYCFEKGQSIDITGVFQDEILYLQSFFMHEKNIFFGNEDAQKSWYETIILLLIVVFIILFWGVQYVQRKPFHSRVLASIE